MNKNIKLNISVNDKCATVNNMKCAIGDYRFLKLEKGISVETYQGSLSAIYENVTINGNTFQDLDELWDALDDLFVKPEPEV